MKIEWDQENNIIRVGKAEFTQFEWYGKKINAWANKVLRENGLDEFRLNEYAKNDKAKNKAVCDALGCSRTVLYKHYDALSKKVFLAPVYDIVTKIAYSRKGWPVKVINKVNKHKNIAQQVFDDKLYNILPVVVATGKSPQQLKKEMKNAWKIVCSNSLNRNKILAKMVHFNAENWTSDAMIKHFANDIPITLLQNRGLSTQMSALEYLRDNFKGKWGKEHDMMREQRVFRDTEMLAQQLEEKFDPKWSPRRMKEEHDRFSKELTARRFSPVPFEWTKDLPKEIEHEGYKATLLNSRFLIAEEGTAMGHCVAGYAEQVASGNYLVYSVTKDGERSSTVGLYRGKDVEVYKQSELADIRTFIGTARSWRLQQHYGKYNEYLKEEAEKQIGNKIVEALNLKEKELCSSLS